VEIVAESEGWLTYEFPDELRHRAWGGRFAGQAQRWFLMRFTGGDLDIDIAASKPAEFAAWRWMPLDDLVRGVVAFKHPVYVRVAAEFGPAIRGASDPG
jgi:putative (di)nucleoside polyphosphate hydrolase